MIEKLMLRATKFSSGQPKLGLVVWHLPSGQPGFFPNFEHWCYSSDFAESKWNDGIDTKLLNVVKNEGKLI